MINGRKTFLPDGSLLIWFVSLRLCVLLCGFAWKNEFHAKARRKTQRRKEVRLGYYVPDFLFDEHRYSPTRRLSTFQYDTGRTRAISEMIFASEPMRMRSLRCSMPRAIVSPAISGGIRKSFRYFSRR